MKNDAQRLTQSIAHQVSQAVRDRGNRYYLTGAVKSLSADKYEITASVLGSHNYGVSVALTDFGLITSCDCPYFEGGSDVCKHIWATLLAAEKSGYFFDDSSEEPVFSRKPMLAGNDFRASSTADNITQMRSMTNELVSRSAAPVDETDEHPWAAQLRKVAASQNSGVSDREWPKARELLYIVNAAETNAARSLSLTVAYSDPKRDGSWGKINVQSVSSELISKLVDRHDRHIIPMLVGSQDRYYGYSSYSYGGNSKTPLAVPQSVADFVIPLVCQSGRGFIRNNVADGQLRATTGSFQRSDSSPSNLPTQACPYRSRIYSAMTTACLQSPLDLW